MFQRRAEQYSTDGTPAAISTRYAAGNLSSPTMRDRHLQIVTGRGRMAWQKVSGYNWHALVEANISRFKWVIGDGLRSRTDRRRATEVAIAVGALNRMFELGRPDYVRLG